MDDVPPVLDPAALAQLEALRSDVDPHLVEDVLKSFLRESPERLTALRAAAERGDAGGVERLAHGLKSSAALVGALELSGILGDLEQRAMAGTADAGLARDSLAAFARVRSALESRIAERAARGGAPT